MHTPQLAHPKLRGEWAEVYFMQRAMARGLVVSKPYGESHKYDFIVDSAGRLSRVQVRAAFALAGSCYVLRAGSGMNCRPYSPSEIDFIAACVVPEFAWYIVPVTELAGRQFLHLAPHRPNAAGRFEKFREAWELLHQNDRPKQAV